MAKGLGSSPASWEEVQNIKRAIGYWLTIAGAVALAVVLLLAWMDGRKTPVIVFMATPQTDIAIDLRGAVNTPGVVYLPPGSRMIDAVEEGGGLVTNADESLINLSSFVYDGQMIVVPTAPVAGIADTTLININTASIEELRQLPGIGEVFAQRIVEYRTANGPFTRADDLLQVQGMTYSTIEQIRPLITFSSYD